MRSWIGWASRVCLLAGYEDRSSRGKRVERTASRNSQLGTKAVLTWISKSEVFLLTRRTSPCLAFGPALRRAFPEAARCSSSVTERDRVLPLAAACGNPCNVSLLLKPRKLDDNHANLGFCMGISNVILHVTSQYIQLFTRCESRYVQTLNTHAMLGFRSRNAAHDSLFPKIHPYGMIHVAEQRGLHASMKEVIALSNLINIELALGWYFRKGQWQPREKLSMINLLRLAGLADFRPVVFFVSR